MCAKICCPTLNSISGAISLKYLRKESLGSLPFLMTIILYHVHHIQRLRTSVYVESKSCFGGTFTFKKIEKKI